MKKHILLILYLLIVNSLAAQQVKNAGQKINKDYLKKSKNAKRTGFILLGGGAALFTTGIIAMQHTTSKGSEEFPIVLGGMAVTISSVPFFISSAVNKHKAKLELKRNELKTNAGTNKSIYQTTVSFKIDL